MDELREVMNEVVQLPRHPVVGSAWQLRDVLPNAGEAYLASVERVWRDMDGRLMAKFVGEGGRAFAAEVWIRREPDSKEQEQEFQDAAMAARREMTDEREACGA